MYPTLAYNGESLNCGKEVVHDSIQSIKPTDDLDHKIRLKGQVKPFIFCDLINGQAGFGLLTVEVIQKFPYQF